MKVRPIPANVLNGFCTTLDTYIPGVTPTVFVAAFQAYGDTKAAAPRPRRAPVAQLARVRPRPWPE